LRRNGRRVRAIPPKSKTGARRAPDAADTLLGLVSQSLDDDKAEDIVVIDLHGKSSIADYLVIASGRSSRQVASMAEHLAHKLKEAGARRVAVEGARQGDWVLIDGGDLIVHLFRPEVRRFYNLEKMWGMTLPEPDKAAAALA
jgi:ribosome-associated protein